MERRLHIIYFLNWMNQVEHPHLIQVDHLIHSEIRLRDVKRWLADRRGKDMPNLFAWSCKRKYKMGYVWQDLMEEDIITPISGHELVLKGSLISFSAGCDSLSMFQRLEQLQQCLGKIRSTDSSITSNMDSIPKVSNKPYHSQCKLQKPSNSTPASHWDEHYPMKSVSEIVEVIDDVKHHSYSSSIASSSTLRNDIFEGDELFVTSPSPPYLSPKKKSHSGGTFLNLLTCGVIQTNDSTVNKNSGHFVDFHKRRHHNWVSCFDGTQSMKEPTKLPGCKLRYSMLKPSIEPNCSQCGESFEPEKLQKHMKSCRGLNKQGKGNNVAASIAEKMSAEIGFTY